MSEQLKVTSPEEYAAIVERHAETEGELVPLSSGMVIRARRVDLEGRALKGGLPLSLVAATQEKHQSEGDENRQPSPEEIRENEKILIYMRETTRKSAIEPALVYDETGEVVWQWPNGIRREVLTADFKDLFAWASGQEVDTLDSFRNRKERRASAAQSRRKNVRGKAERDASGVPAEA